MSPRRPRPDSSRGLSQAAKTIYAPGKGPRTTPDPAPFDNETVRPATRPETLPIGLMAIVAAFLALAVSATHGYMLLYGDAVSHLGIARGLIDTATPGLRNLGDVWLPLPHLLMLPFVWKMQWWQNGMAGAFPSILCFILAVLGMYRLARRLMPPGWAFVATAFFGLNANLLYLSGTAMTEPLFLALFVWLVLITLELREPLTRAEKTRANRLQSLLGLLILCAVMTRYDGWILGAALWCVVAWQVLRSANLRRTALPGFILLTVLALAGPLFWFWFNYDLGHDWLDFMRGPYSPAAIDRRTSPPGSHHHFGWHDPLYSLVLYARCAQVDAAAWETGWLVAAASLYALWQVFRQRAWHFTRQTLVLDRAILLLWVPLPFYVYSVSYGSVPIFIPQLYPNSFYNSRYGMEMLPALAVFATLAIIALAARLAQAQSKAPKLLAQLAQPLSLLLVAVNLVWMTYTTPLVLKEGIVNSRGRLALEVPLAEQLATIPRDQPILIENSDRVGALQTAGIPLAQTIGPGDYYRWRDALADPARAAAWVFASDGDPIADAVKAHPQGLAEQSILCTSKQPCLRIYRSTLYHR